MNLNKVYIIGHLAADPEFRTTSTGQEIATLRVATNRVWIDQNTGQKNETTEFHNVVTWGRLAQIANQYLTKGRLVMIEGRLQTRSWEGQDGVKRYRTEIIAENLQLGPRPANAPSMPIASEEKKASVKVEKEEIPVVNEETPIAETASDEESADETSSEDSTEETTELKNVPF